MSKKRGLVLIVFGFVLALAFLVSAIPQTFNINGKLTDSNGVALSGDYNFNFSIYNNATGGTYLWNSGVLSVTTDSNGIYHVEVFENYFEHPKVLTTLQEGLFDLISGQCRASGY